MNFLKKWLRPSKDEPEKKKVCWLVLGKMLGGLLFLQAEEEDELGTLDEHNPKILHEIIREYVVPHYHYFSPENQEKLKNSLTYYLNADNEKLEWIFSSLYAPLDDDVAKLFYTIVWKELYGTDGPDPINQNDYEEDCSSQFFNSITYSGTLEKKYNPEGKKPSVANIIARLKRNS